MLRKLRRDVVTRLQSHSRQLRLLSPGTRRLRSWDRYGTHDGLLWTVAEEIGHREVEAVNEDLVTSLLDDRSIAWVRIRNTHPFRASLAIADEHWARFEAAIREGLVGEAVYLQTIESGRSPKRARPTSAALLASPSAARMREARVVRLGRLFEDAAAGTRFDLSHGCDVERWQPTELDGEPAWTSARPTSVGSVIPESILGLSDEPPLGPCIFDRVLLDDISFPIDAVYTWVDGADPVWRSKLNEHRVAAGYHEEATAPSRFTSRDELKYSLRSLFMFAPWIRHVYLVTDGQTPDFIDPDHPRITFVDHGEIAPDPSCLPVFSSNAITTWLHRIPGLSEHYLYLNDDMFFGRPVLPELFFTGAGLCKAFPGNTFRPFGPPSPEDPPHVNLSRNIRSLIESTCGKTFTHAIKHTPYPQRVSVHREMESLFGDVYAKTAGHRFRHHDDIAGDQLFHYYARATGRAIVGSIRYDYVNISSAKGLAGLERLTRRSSAVDVFCLNDGPREGAGVPEPLLRRFLEDRYPLPSPVERATSDQRS